jgi:hypothetical protein
MVDSVTIAFRIDCRGGAIAAAITAAAADFLGRPRVLARGAFVGMFLELANGFHAGAIMRRLAAFSAGATAACAATAFTGATARPGASPGLAATAVAVLPGKDNPRHADFLTLDFPAVLFFLHLFHVKLAAGLTFWTGDTTFFASVDGICRRGH